MFGKQGYEVYLQTTHRLYFKRRVSNHRQVGRREASILGHNFGYVELVTSDVHIRPCEDGTAWVHAEVGGLDHS